MCDGDTDNAYQAGNFSPVAGEITATDLTVIGEIPASLNGRYIRNGPNPELGSTPGNQHWFLGDGMVHGLRLHDGRARWYRNRYVGSTRISTARGEPDIPGPNWNGSDLGPNTNVGAFAGHILATVEAGPCPVELDGDLNTIGRHDFGGTLPGGFSAHPKHDPRTGELHAMAYAWAEWLDHIQYIVIGPTGRVTKTIDIPLGMSMIHDMSLTRQFAIVYDQPCTVNAEVAMSGRFPFRWNPDYGNRVGLLPRDGSAADIIWVEVPLGYAFHPMNAYDTADGNVVIDLCNYPKMFDTDVLGPFGEGAMSRLERWEINPRARTASIDVIDETPNEFPRHRATVGTTEHRFGYCIAPSAEPTAGWPTIKHDLHTGQRTVFDHGAARAAGEAVFVVKPDQVDEDAGWLLLFVHDLGAETTEFVIIDAEDFDRGYVARIPLPQRVPFGFHGNWISDESLAAT